MKTQQKTFKEMSDDELWDARIALAAGPRWHNLDGPAMGLSLVLMLAGCFFLACGGGAGLVFTGLMSLAGAVKFTRHACREAEERHERLKDAKQELDRREELRNQQRAQRLGQGLAAAKQAARAEIIPLFEDAAAIAHAGTPRDMAVKRPLKFRKSPPKRGAS